MRPRENEGPEISTLDSDPDQVYSMIEVKKNFFESGEK